MFGIASLGRERQREARKRLRLLHRRDVNKGHFVLIGQESDVGDSLAVQRFIGFEGNRDVDGVVVLQWWDVRMLVNLLL